MTRPEDSAIAQLARHLVGPPSSDPLTRAMQTAAMTGIQRISEMNEVGFDTKTPFDLSALTHHTTTSQPFLLTSLATKTEYFVVAMERIGNTFRVAVQVHQQGKVNNNYYRMTLVRATDGNIRANPRW